jgi:hypothetical protein
MSFFTNSHSFVLQRCIKAVILSKNEVSDGVSKKAELVLHKPIRLNLISENNLISINYLHGRANELKEISRTKYSVLFHFFSVLLSGFILHLI